MNTSNTPRTRQRTLAAQPAAALHHAASDMGEGPAFRRGFADAGLASHAGGGAAGRRLERLLLVARQMQQH
ncbi:hypothetical protein [Ramlibacter sp.]|uniref:hypothetical protein n=1 Tax=Ramlibacter sp. TaxID=1917967 RepID=UPI003D09DADD